MQGKDAENFKQNMKDAVSQKADKKTLARIKANFEKLHTIAKS